MALSYAEFTGDGSTTLRSISLSFLRRSEVFVSVDLVDTSFTWITDGQIDISPAPADGTAIKIYRATNSTSKEVDFNDASVMTEANLDLLADQLFYLAQEGQDNNAVASATAAAASAAAAVISAAATATSAAAAAASATASAASATAAAASAATIPSNFSTTADPTANSDSANTDTNGAFQINSHWENTSTKDKWICEDATATAAVWRKLVTLNGSSQLPAVDGSLLTGIETGATDVQESRIKTLELRMAAQEDDGINIQEDGFADAFTDESGIDTASSINEAYDSTDNLYKNTIEGQISTSGLTEIGDMTASGGLAAAFDGDTTQVGGSCARKNSTTIGYIGIDWGSGITKTISGFIIYGSSDNGLADAATPDITVTLQGSSDNFSSDSNDLGSIGPTADSTAIIMSKLSGLTQSAYRYHRLKVEVDTSTNIYVAEVEFFEESTANMTLISEDQTAKSEPTTVEALVVNEPVDSVTINTDLTLEVSIDGGSNYDTVTLADEGEFASGQNILRGSVDVTARTGTTMKYRLKTLNTKEQKQIGVVLAWS